MMSIRTITAPPVALPSGTLPAGAAAADGFAALLPAMVVPVVPEGAGKVLPVAGSEHDDMIAGAGVLLWLVPAVMSAAYPGSAEPQFEEADLDVFLTPPATLRTASPVVVDPFAGGHAARPERSDGPANVSPLPTAPLERPSDTGEQGVTQGPLGGAAVPVREDETPGASLTPPGIPQPLNPIGADLLAGGDVARLMPGGTPALTVPPPATSLVSRAEDVGEGVTRRASVGAAPPQRWNAAPGVWQTPSELSLPLSLVAAEPLPGGDPALLVPGRTPVDALPPPASRVDGGGEGVMQRASDGATASKPQYAMPGASLTPPHLLRSPSPIAADPLAGSDGARLVPVSAPAVVVPLTMPPLVSRPEGGGLDVTHSLVGDRWVPVPPESGLAAKTVSAPVVAEKVAASEAASNPDRAVPLPAASVQAIPMMQPAEASRIAPAAQIFAAAIQQMVREERRPSAAEQAIAGIAPSADLTTHGVTAAESSRHPALDMARETWPAKMIERIEMLRDAADANDTSIRLVPDRLGTIDVSLRRDGDTVAVHFQAQQAETRQLIAEAQPRLADMAEARGLRLSTQTGDGGSQPQQQQQRAGASAARANNVSPDAAHAGVTSADQRVA